MRFRGGRKQENSGGQGRGRGCKGDGGAGGTGVQGARGMGSWCSVGTELPFGGMRKCWRGMVVRVAQHCECTR